MNTSQFLTEVADVLDDPDSEMYPAEEIVRHGNRQLRGLYRTLVESNKQYSNFTMAVQAEVALEPIDNIFDYRLPNWVMAVTRVWIRNGSATSEPNLSLYSWTPGAAQLGNEIPKVGNEVSQRWSWQGNSTVRLHNFSSAQELVLEVVVRPASMAKAKIATENASTSKLYLPPSLNYGEIDLEEGAYINSDWQVTTTANTNATHYGDIRRCVYSTPSAISSGSRYVELTFDAAWTNALVQNDVVETVLALPDEHTRVLVLLAARACFQKKGNLKGLEAIQGELLQEQTRFSQYATPPRDSRGPSEWKQRNPYALRRFPNYRYPYGSV